MSPSAGDGSTGGTATPAWTGACDDLLSRLPSDREVARAAGRGTGPAYLRAILSFLRAVGSGVPGIGGHAPVLDGAGLRLSDRVAFAARFLDRPSLHAALDAALRRCASSGDLEGVAISGLGRRGIGLVQSYVDRTSDVQTAALLAARAALPGDREWTAERRAAGEWTESYRSLLNGAGMWGARAAFDVARMDGHRRLRGEGGTGPASGTAPSAPAKYQGGQARAARQGQARAQHISPPPPSASAAAPGAGAPPNLWARCNYCNASLPLSRLRRQEGIANSWLSRQKPVLSCCPQCKKPLPRCAVCLLPMGCLNPYIELQRERGAYSRAGGTGKQQQQQQGVEDLSGLAAVPFSNWWSWCLKVRSVFLVLFSFVSRLWSLFSLIGPLTASLASIG